MKKITGGLYFLYKGNQLVYIGKSSNIFQRIGTHIKENVKDFDNWEYQIIEDEHQRSEMEGYLIEIYKPKYNEKSEPNSIFSKNKHIKNEKQWKIDQIINNYQEIMNYDYIPIKALDNIFGVDNFILDLKWQGYIPENVINEETIYGYTKGVFIEKSWALKHLKYLWDSYDDSKRR